VLAARIVTIVGGAVIVISTLLNWGKQIRDPRGGTLAPSRTGFSEPAKLTIDYHARPGGLSIGVVVLVIGLLTIAAAWAPWRQILSVALGVIAGVTAFLYVFGVHRLIVNELHSRIGLRRLVGIGPYVTAVGGGIALIGGLIEFVPRFLGPAEEEEEEEPEASPGAPREP
jgi:hypothetical protein